MRIGSLFSGIGGLELGLEWAGLGPVVWQVEQEPFCREVLARHWPDATRFDDVRTVGSANLAPVDLICGGFPCQDISNAGHGAGIDGARSGLWREFARIIRELRPRFAIVENVPALLGRGMGVVLGDLAALGFDAWWDCIPAAAVGAGHERDRLFIVAYPDVRSGKRLRQDDPEQARGRRGRQSLDRAPSDSGPGRATQPRVVRGLHGLPGGLDRLAASVYEPQREWEAPRFAETEAPRQGRRVRTLGNAVVPQVAYVIGCVVREIEAAARLAACEQGGRER